MARYFIYHNKQTTKTPAFKIMKRIFITFVVVLISITVLKAQTSFGIQAGAINSSIKGEAMKNLNSVVDLSNGIINTSSKIGITAGGYAHIPISKAISIEPGINYSQKGYTIEGDLKIDALKFLGANARAKVNAHYIDIPVLLKAEVTKGLTAFAGPQFSYLIKNNLHVNAGVLGISLYNNRLDITDNFNRIDMGISGGFGYRFDNGINIKAAYDHGLSRVDKNKNFNAYNNAVKLVIGFTF